MTERRERSRAPRSFEVQLNTSLQPLSELNTALQQTRFLFQELGARVNMKPRFSLKDGQFDYSRLFLTVSPVDDSRRRLSREQTEEMFQLLYLNPDVRKQLLEQYKSKPQK